MFSVSLHRTLIQFYQRSGIPLTTTMAQQHSRGVQKPKHNIQSSISYPEITSTFLDVFNRDQQYPIFDRLCSILPISDIIALSRTCRNYSNLYRYLVPTQWNVDRKLRRFVRNPQEFRSRMGQHNAIISGSFVLQYFERVYWEESDLDIFILDGIDADDFCHYLIRGEGYICTGFRAEKPYGRLSAVSVRC